MNSFWNGFEKQASKRGLWEAIKDIPHRVKKESLRVAAKDVWDASKPHRVIAQQHLKKHPKKYIAGALGIGGAGGYLASKSKKEEEK